MNVGPESRRRARRGVLLCAVVLLVSQASGAAKEKITFTPKGDERHTAKKADCVIDVFPDERPEGPLTEIGWVNYHDERHRMSDAELKVEVALPKMKAAACKAGGEALVDVKVTEIRRLEFAIFNVRATLVRRPVDSGRP